MDTKEQLKEFQEKIEKSLGQSGPIYRSEQSSKATNAMRISGGFITTHKGAENDYTEDYRIFRKWAMYIWENSKGLDEPPLDDNHRTGVEKLWTWCVKCIRKIGNEKYLWYNNETARISKSDADNEAGRSVVNKAIKDGKLRHHNPKNKKAHWINKADFDKLKRSLSESLKAYVPESDDVVERKYQQVQKELKSSKETKVKHVNIFPKD